MAQWMFLPYKRYAEFSGRSRREEFWLFAAFTVIVNAILVGFAANAQTLGEEGSFSFWHIIWIAFNLVNLLPTLAVIVRRFHDQNKSGWFAALVIIPAIGWLVVLVFMAMPGDDGPNQYGPDPRA